VSIRRQVVTTVYAGFLFGVLGLIAWASGQAFVFPSLGPSAFVLAFDRHADRGQLREIVLAHAIGCVGGFAAWTLVSPGAVITTTPPPFSAAGFELVSSAVLSIVSTTLGMVWLGEIHPPACATTLIVSLGLLSTPLAVTIIVVSVSLLVVVHASVVFGFGRLVDAYARAGE
jgi:hypothetical protein